MLLDLASSYLGIENQIDFRYAKLWNENQIVIISQNSGQVISK